VGEAPGNGKEDEANTAVEGDLARNGLALSRRNSNGGTASRRGLSPMTVLSAAGKDEVDARLNGFLEQAQNCNIVFRRRNRGWYTFRRADEPPSNEKNVEVSIVNGKLMARLESSSHDRGWNNGKLGPMDRFVAHFSG